MTRQQRAALMLYTGNVNDAHIQAEQEACRRYCQEQGYQLSEQHIYQDEGKPWWSTIPQFVQLRMLVVQGQIDVLVIPRAEYLGVLPLWSDLSTSTTIGEFYSYQVRIESVIKRHGVHDLYKQMLLDAIETVKQIHAARTEARYLSSRYRQQRKQF